ncbi:hypothetical protein [Nonomuraea sp. SYSU D8015]|uniref:hypothetical protein n=1 Tax=Nonomuraea sp. SYSU D8015 TaxID=2593644 RepID=UPI00166129C2|nr:hypothetical protein [Nonomuraea sp. SYSU D8015]
MHDIHPAQDNQHHAVPVTDGITWDQLRADECGPCTAAACNIPLVVATVIIDGRRYPVCREDAELIPGFTPNLSERSVT